MPKQESTASQSQTSPVGRYKATFYVAFSDGEMFEWWMNPFVRKGFGHCKCMAQLGDVCSIVDPRAHIILQQVFHESITPDKIELDSDVLNELQAGGYKITRPLPVAEVAKAWASTGYTVLEYETVVDSSRKMNHITLCVPTCVSVVKAFLGISSWSVTPFQLHNWLLKNGAKKI